MIISKEAVSWSLAIICSVFVVAISGDESKFSPSFQGSPGDSYLDAYANSKQETGSVFTLASANQPTNSERKYSEFGDYSYPAAPQYSPPQYAPPNIGSNQYGPPAPPPPPPPPPPKYGPPAPIYGPPVPVYGPPRPLRPVYGKPHGMLGILDNINFKLDLFTIGKILLKFVIFKKIVSLIAILCLLLFIPTLKHKDKPDTSSSGEDSAEDGDDDDSFRNFNAGDKRLDNITTFVLEAIENFSKLDDHRSQELNSKKCQGVFCKIQHVMNKIDSRISDKKLVKLYSMEPK